MDSSRLETIVENGQSHHFLVALNYMLSVLKTY